MNPLVSIITPNYNAAPFLKRCFDSVLNQSYSNWELIVIDDASTDESLEIIKDYQREHEKMQCITLKENSGPAVARNKGIEQAKGDYIAFLDSDDCWLPSKLETQIQFMQKHNYRLSFSWYYSVDESFENKRLIKSNPIITYNKLLSSNYLGCLTVMYDQNALGKMYFPRLAKRQDWALWLKILRENRINAYGIEKPLAIYTRRLGSVSSNKIKLLKFNWMVYRLEKVPLIKSVFLLKLLIIKRLFR